MDYYPSNTVGRFSTKLPHSIALDGDREVALMELLVPVTLSNVLKGVCLVHLKGETDMASVTVTVEAACVTCWNSTLMTSCRLLESRSGSPETE